MDEPALYNHSGFHVSVLPILDRDGAPSRVVIIKATYEIRREGGLQPLAEPREARLGDEPWGAPEIPDLKLPSDFCAAKPGTDFVFSGHAVPRSVTDRHVDVVIRVADRMKHLRVHGARMWRASPRGVVPGPSAPVRSTPLAWSRAYGGLDLTDPRRPLEEPRNPVGTGVARDVGRLVDTPAPQIEAPDEPIGAAGSPHVPAGCAPLGRNFEPRRSAMGTYDARWLDAGYPARPADYREAHENCAPPDFVFNNPMQGGEPITVAGVHADGPLAFLVPRHRILVQAEIDGSLVERRPHLDTVVVDGDPRVVEFVWRALFRCPVKMRNRFTFVRVQAKRFVS